MSLVDAQTEGRGKPRNLDNFASVNSEIVRTGPRNLVEFSAENCEP